MSLCRCQTGRASPIIALEGAGTRVHVASLLPLRRPVAWCCPLRAREARRLHVQHFEWIAELNMTSKQQQREGTIQRRERTTSRRAPRLPPLPQQRSAAAGGSRQPAWTSDRSADQSRAHGTEDGVGEVQGAQAQAARPLQQLLVCGQRLWRQESGKMTRG